MNGANLLYWVTQLIAIVVVPFVARGEIYDREARRHRTIHDDRS